MNDSKKAFQEIVDEHLRQWRARIHDDVLIGYYNLIYRQFKAGNSKRERTLVEYVNEMCYRGLEHKLKKN